MSLDIAFWAGFSFNGNFPIHGLPESKLFTGVCEEAHRRSAWHWISHHPVLAITDLGDDVLGRSLYRRLALRYNSVFSTRTSHGGDLEALCGDVLEFLKLKTGCCQCQIILQPWLMLGDEVKASSETCWHTTIAPRGRAAADNVTFFN
jgi:hypothetical protein